MSEMGSDTGSDRGHTSQPAAHRELYTWLGAYVVGELDPAGRHLVDDHVSACDTCRRELARLAPLPALVRQVIATGSERTPGSGSSSGSGVSSSGGVGGSESSEPPSRVVVQARRRVASRRRTRVLVTTVALLIAGAAGASVVGARTTSSVARSSPTSSPRSGTRYLQLTAVESHVTATPGPAPSGVATLMNRGWGAQVVLEVAHVPEASTYDCVVVGPGGTQIAGTWLGTATGTASITVAVAMHPQSVSAVEVVNSNGTVILRSTAAAPHVRAAYRDTA